MPKRVRYAWAELPGELVSLDPRGDHLRQGLFFTQELGKQWLAHGNSLAVRVPSALIPQEDHLLLNPLHADYALQWHPAPFDWDQRLADLVRLRP